MVPFEVMFCRAFLSSHRLIEQMRLVETFLITRQKPLKAQQTYYEWVNNHMGQREGEVWSP